MGANPKRSFRQGFATVARHSVRPMRKIMRHTLPMPAQRSQLAKCLQGDLRIAPKRKSHLEDALQRSHVDGAKSFIKGRKDTDPTVSYGGYLKGSFVPVGAAPMLLVVPACLACETTRSAMILMAFLPFLCALAMTLISKPALDYDM